MSKKTRLILIFTGLFLLFAFVIPYLVVQKFESVEAFQTFIQNMGPWGYSVYTLAAILTTVILPLNYSILGLAGGLAYGTGPAFLMLWVGRVLGNFINFALAKNLGRSVIKVFVAEENLHKYDKLLESEKALLLYFVLCFLPFVPGDYAAYFLGCSKMKKLVFVPVTILANIGCAFSLAYMGSGKAFTDPIFLSVFSVVFLSGVSWIHSQKKKFHLT